MICQLLFLQESILTSEIATVFIFDQNYYKWPLGDAKELCLQGKSVQTYVKTYFFYNLQLSEVYAFDCQPVPNFVD